MKHWVPEVLLFSVSKLLYETEKSFDKIFINEFSTRLAKL